MTIIPHRDAACRSGLVPLPLVPSAYGVTHRGVGVGVASSADQADGPSLSVGTLGPSPAVPAREAAFGTYRPAEPTWSAGNEPSLDFGSGVRRDEVDAPPAPRDDHAPSVPSKAANNAAPSSHAGHAPAGAPVTQEAAPETLRFPATGQTLVRDAPRRPEGFGNRVKKVRSTYASLSWPKKIIFGIAGLIAGYLALILFLLLIYRFINPPVSSLMVQRWLGGASIEHDWVPIERMSPNIVRAVISSEDARFCQHFGVDIQELQNAIERGGDGPPRGGSTISMQVVKNLFLWPAKSYVRKAIELPTTYVMEFLWPKSRVLEVYLNIAEWGPGVFGVEAAAQHHFGKSAAALSEREAARLAVSLPNPFVRVAGKPGPGTRRLATIIQSRMRQLGSEWLSCVLPGSEASR